MEGPARYVAWINAHLGFNPRGAANSNALSDYVLDDLRLRSPALDGQVSTEDLLSIKNADVAVGAAGLTIRNIDLVLREKDAPLNVQLSVENKTIMTAHGKAR